MANDRYIRCYTTIYNKFYNMLYSIHMFCSIVNAYYITKVSNDIFDILGNMLFMCLCLM